MWGKQDRIIRKACVMTLAAMTALAPIGAQAVNVTATYGDGQVKVTGSAFNGDYTDGTYTVTIDGTQVANGSISGSSFETSVSGTYEPGKTYTVQAQIATVDEATKESRTDTGSATFTPPQPQPPQVALTMRAMSAGETVTVSGTATPGATVTAQIDGVEKSTTVAADGAYSIQFTDVTPGTCHVTVKDSAGQTASMDVTVTAKTDTVVQKDIAITNVTPGEETVTVAGTASVGASVKVSGFGKEAVAATDENGNFTCVLTGVAAGTYNAVNVSYVDTKTYTGRSAGISDGTWTVTARAQQKDTTIVITSATGGQGSVTVAGTAKAGEKLTVTMKNEKTGFSTALEATADTNGAFTQTMNGLEAGSYTVSVAYQNVSVGAGANRTGIAVSSVPAVKAGISLDKLYETSLTVVGRTSANCSVTVKAVYGGKEVSITRTSGADGIFRIPLPRTLSKHTEITATVTYADGTTETATGHVYAGSATQEYNVTYYVGSKGNEIYDLEDRLRQLGYPITPDRVYDKETERVICAFQRNNGLGVDGMAGPKTLAKLYSVTAVGYTETPPSGDSTIYLQRGSRGALVSEVQSRLKELGYYTIRVDGIYGVGTQTAVRAFQRNNGLSVTGVVESDTYKAIMSSNAVGVGGIYDPNAQYVELRRGNRGDAVVRLQSRLQYLGYYTISVDGIYGSATQTAVRRFQSRNGISANGVATVYTQQVLFGSSAVANTPSGVGTTTGYVYLHYGSRGTAVNRLQQALKKAGYYKGAVDGLYYDQTYAAVKAFQRAVGLSADGIAGRKTQNALYGTNY